MLGTAELITLSSFKIPMKKKKKKKKKCHWSCLGIVYTYTSTKPFLKLKSAYYTYIVKYGMQQIIL